MARKGISLNVASLPLRGAAAPAWVRTLVVQLLRCIRHFATPWTAARQSPRSFTVSQGLLKSMSIESVVLSNQLFRPL